MIRKPQIGRPPFIEDAELQTLRLRLSTGAAFAVASDRPSAIEGAHADQLLYVFDEAKAIGDGTWDATEGAFSGSGADTDSHAYALAISTPGAPQGRFYAIHARQSGYEDWAVAHVTLSDAIAAGRVSQDWADQRAAQWGERSAVYQNRVLGEFAAADEDTVIPLAWIEAAVERWRDGQASEVTAVALDVADGGADRSVLAIRHGIRIDEIRDITQAETGATMALAGIAKGAANGAPIIVDSIGVGAGVVSRLRELGETVVAFNAGGGTKGTDESGELGFLNKRAASWWGLRERLHPETGDGLELPPDDELLGDLTSPRWTVTSTGKIKVESKDDIRKRIGRSTDCGDAAVMAYWEEPTARGAAIPVGAGMTGGFTTTTRKASRYHKTKPHERYGRRDR